MSPNTQRNLGRAGRDRNTLFTDEEDEDTDPSSALLQATEPGRGHRGMNPGLSGTKVFLFPLLCSQVPRNKLFLEAKESMTELAQLLPEAGLPLFCRRWPLPDACRTFAILVDAVACLRHLENNV